VLGCCSSFSATSVWAQIFWTLRSWPTAWADSCVISK
jgi:hypothetical protein